MMIMIDLWSSSILPLVRDYCLKFYYLLTIQCTVCYVPSIFIFYVCVHLLFVFVLLNRGASIDHHTSDDNYNLLGASILCRVFHFSFLFFGGWSIIVLGWFYFQIILVELNKFLADHYRYFVTYHANLSILSTLYQSLTVNTSTMIDQWKSLHEISMFMCCFGLN